MKNLPVVLLMLFFLFQVVLFGLVIFNGQGNDAGLAFFVAAGVLIVMIYYLLADPEGTE